MSTTVFDLKRGCVAYDGVHVLEDVDLVVPPGEFLAVLGPNGSGKTTLVRALLGLEPLSHGSLRLYGQPLARFRDWERIALVPQRLPGAGAVPVSVWETVLSGLISPKRRWRPFSREEKQRAGDALEAVELADRRHDRLDTLSGGQQRRVLLARALASGADTFVLDEPTAGVDAASQEKLAQTLGMLSEAGRTVLLVTHELGSLEHLFTRVLVLGRGGRDSVAYDGPPPPPGTFTDHVHHHEPLRDPSRGPAGGPLMEP